MHELLVDGADELDRDHVKPVGEEVELTGFQVLATQESRHLVEMPGGGAGSEEDGNMSPLKVSRNPANRRPAAAGSRSASARSP